MFGSNNVSKTYIKVVNYGKYKFRNIRYIDNCGKGKLAVTQTRLSIAPVLG